MDYYRKFHRYLQSIYPDGTQRSCSLFATRRGIHFMVSTDEYYYYPMTEYRGKSLKCPMQVPIYGDYSSRDMCIIALYWLLQYVDIHNTFDDIDPTLLLKEYDPSVMISFKYYTNLNYRRLDVHSIEFIINRRYKVAKNYLTGSDSLSITVTKDLSDTSSGCETITITKNGFAEVVRVASDGTIKNTIDSVWKIMEN